MSSNRFAQGCAFVNSEYVPIAEASVPILDMGFLRSDVTYDVVAVWNGKFFRLDDHLDRFERSCTSLNMSPEISRQGIRDALIGCVRRAQLKEAYVDMIMTRGISENGNRDPRRFQNRFYGFAIPYVWLVPFDQQEQGIHLVIAQRTIRTPTMAFDPTIKNFQWGDLTQGIYEAYARDGYTVVLPDEQGNITEGPGFNVFMMQSGRLLTPASGVLRGITRQTVLDLAEEQGISAEETSISADQLRHADEVFLSSTAGGVIPVTTLDGHAVADGKAGSATRRLRQRYWEAHDETRWTTPVDY
jgi:branched-chain amino acid aminotransferase